jgi:peroxiredoxin
VGKDVNSAISKARAMPGPLAARLDAIADAYKVELPGYSLAIDRFVARLRTVGAGASAPNIGDVFPDFTLPDAKGKLWHLGRCLIDGPAVLSFHRGSWCDFCQLNMRSLSEIAPKVEALGSQIFAIAPEKAGVSAVFETEATSSFPILRDVGLGVSTMLGLTCFVDETLRHELEVLQVDINAANGGAGWLVPIPATFVLNSDGRVVARHVDPDPRARMEGMAIVQAATACQSAARS